MCVPCQVEFRSRAMFMGHAIMAHGLNRQRVWLLVETAPAGDLLLVRSAAGRWLIATQPPLL